MDDPVSHVDMLDNNLAKNLECADPGIFNVENFQVHTAIEEAEMYHYHSYNDPTHGHMWLQ
ncbi:hypothetical protein FQN51_003492 [Onygenales sp. PD_10]|nr:hypothetical protein FQN51_003492 [Onygenales sp. PD_10]